MDIFSYFTKLLIFKITGLIILLNIVSHSHKCEINEEHRRCKDHHEATQCFCDCTLLNITLLAMTDSEIKSIVNTINVLRNRIAKGRMMSFPKAASMTVMQWDDELAEAASKKLMVCTDPTDLFYNDVIQFSQMQAIAIYISVYNRSNTDLNETILRNFFHDAKYFNVSSLMDYPCSGLSMCFTTLARHDSLFVGCAMAEIRYEENLMAEDSIESVCFFAASDEAKHNVLYKPGRPCSDCPFSHVGFYCSNKYTSLCTRPDWNISNPRTQNESYLKGFEKRMNMSLRVVPSCYLPIIIFFCFLYHNIYIYR